MKADFNTSFQMEQTQLITGPDEEVCFFRCPTSLFSPFPHPVTQEGLEMMVSKTVKDE